MAEIRDELSVPTDDMAEAEVPMADLPPDLAELGGEGQVGASTGEEVSFEEEPEFEEVEDGPTAGPGPEFEEDEELSGPGDEIPEYPDDPEPVPDQPSVFGGGRPSSVGRRVEDGRGGLSGRPVVDNPVFDTQGAPVVVQGGFQVRPVEQSIEDGLSFILMGKSPAKYLSEKAQAIIRAGGNRIEAVAPGDPMLLPPHEAQNRIVAAGIEPQTQVRKAAARRRAFSADTLLDEQQVPRVGGAPVIPAPAAPIPVISGPIPSGPPAGGAPLVVQLPPPEAEPERAPEAPALRFHAESALKPPPAKDEAGKGTKKGEAVVPAPVRPSVRGPEALGPLASRGGGAWGWVGLGVAALALFALWRAQEGARGVQQDVVVVYAMDQRDQAVAFLNREIGLLEESIGQMETEITVISRSMTAEPTSEQWGMIQKLARERNSQAIALEALRLRRRMIVRGGEAK